MLNEFSHEQLHLLDEILGKTKMSLMRSNGNEKINKDLGDMLTKIRHHPFYSSNNYEVNLTATLHKKILVTANSPAEAIEQAKNLYNQGEITFYPENIIETNFKFSL